MKERGKINIYFSTDQEHWTTVSCGWTLYYLEPKSDKIKCIDYKDLESENFNLHKPGLFNRKEYKYYSYGWKDYFCVKPDEKLYIKYQWVKDDAVRSFDELSKRMQAEDFIEYMKDHGLNVCPIGGN